MIELKDVSKVYGRIQALDNVSMSIEKGGITGFIGPNGAGKRVNCLPLSAVTAQEKQP